jgi:catechol 2,3-dioxygenase-like lactoylglutathione lyase family enzyme
MDLTVHQAFLPHHDPDAALAFWRDTLGFEVRNDVGYGGMRWITVGPADQPGTSIVLGPPSPPGRGRTDDERRVIVEMMAKGTDGWILLATADLDGTLARLQASAEVVGSRPGSRTGLATAPSATPRATRSASTSSPAHSLQA